MPLIFEKSVQCLLLLEQDIKIGRYISWLLNFCCSHETCSKRRAYRREGRNKHKILSAQRRLIRVGLLYYLQILSLGKNKQTKQTKTTQNKSL